MTSRENSLKNVYLASLSHAGDRFLATIIVITALLSVADDRATVSRAAISRAALITINYFLFSIITVIALLLHPR